MKGFVYGWEVDIKWLILSPTTASWSRMRGWQ